MLFKSRGETLGYYLIKAFAGCSVSVPRVSGARAAGVNPPFCVTMFAPACGCKLSSFLSVAMAALTGMVEDPMSSSTSLPATIAPACVKLHRGWVDLVYLSVRNVFLKPGRVDFVGARCLLHHIDERKSNTLGCGNDGTCTWHRFEIGKFWQRVYHTAQYLLGATPNHLAECCPCWVVRTGSHAD